MKPENAKCLICDRSATHVLNVGRIPLGNGGELSAVTAHYCAAHAASVADKLRTTGRTVVVQTRERDRWQG